MVDVPVVLRPPGGAPALPVDRPPTAPPGFHVLAKPSGPICNLDCTYCFFLEKEALYPGDRFRMSDDVLATYIRQVIESQLGPEVTIAWQGGEPTLMGLDFFRRAVGLVNEHKRPDHEARQSIERTASRASSPAGSPPSSTMSDLWAKIKALLATNPADDWGWYTTT